MRSGDAPRIGWRTNSTLLGAIAARDAARNIRGSERRQYRLRSNQGRVTSKSIEHKEFGTVPRSMGGAKGECQHSTTQRRRVHEYSAFRERKKNMRIPFA